MNKKKIIKILTINLDKGGAEKVVSFQNKLFS